VISVRFVNRTDAGRQLADKLGYLRGQKNLVILGLPRGGVPVAFEVARALSSPLDVLGVRKLGVPVQPELAMGAIGEDGVRVLNPEVMRIARTGPEQVAAVEGVERAELDRRLRTFRQGRGRAAVSGRVAVVVDDGAATGSTARAACEVARAQGAARVVLAVPVAPPGVASALRDVADEVVCVQTPTTLTAIGEFYQDFGQTSDEEVVSLLRRADADADEPRDVTVVAGTAALAGRLRMPAGATGIVVFAHGSGSSRHSPRNRYVADILAEAGLGTLLFDLLGPDELDRGYVFDIDLLSRRLSDAIDWLAAQPDTAGHAVGLFGASTGAAAALRVAARPGARIAAVVCRGGRPDLASGALPAVRAPTLLVVGALDRTVRFLNETARTRLTCENRLEIVPGATHLFEEPGTLEVVARSARDWFVGHMAGGGPRGTPHNGPHERPDYGPHGGPTASGSADVGP
jgi:putative phosphoribosyl transferase